MKTFNISLSKIFNGISPKIIEDTSQPMMSDCHNLVPVEDGYDLHALITDMNADGVSWGGEGAFVSDDWTDDDSDIWTDDGTDVFTDD